MAREQHFICPLPNGLHARPASLFQEKTRRFSSEVHLINERNGVQANAKSVLSLMSADLRSNDPFRLLVQGSDESEAELALGKYLREEFASSEIPVAAPEPQPQTTVLPRTLTLSTRHYRTGKIISGGIGRGHLRRLDAWSLPSEIFSEIPASAQVEMDRFQTAHQQLQQSLIEQIKHAPAANPVLRELLTAHLAILDDDTYLKQVTSFLWDSRYSVGRAVHEATAIFTERLLTTKNSYLQERVLDLQDLSRQLLEFIYGKTSLALPLLFDQPTVILADHLTPSQFLSFDRTYLQGLILGQAGFTSHTSILARSFGIPLLENLVPSFKGNLPSEVIVDANLGILVTELTPEALRYYDRQGKKLAAQKERSKAQALGPAQTRDLVPLAVLANISSAEEVGPALENGAEGIGLFRTEMLFLDRPAAPSEEEQFEVYARAVESAAGYPLTIRTFDIGGDKPADYLNLPKETNPFLGYRGARLYPEFKTLFEDQLRAILRASFLGPIKIMFPMISNPEEATELLSCLYEQQNLLRNSGLTGQMQIEVGLMLEVPSAVFCLSELCRDFSFFSVGSNDLLQYFFAADRDNAQVSPLASPLAPSFWRLLKMATEEVHRLDRTIGLCGEMAGDPSLLPLFVGLGFDSISMAAPKIDRIKGAIHLLDSPACRETVGQALEAIDHFEIQDLLRGGGSSIRQLPIVSKSLFALYSDVSGKAEAIEELIDLLEADGRIRNKASVIESIWNREALYSTAMDFGIAIPHCKSDEITAPSVALLRPAHSISWDDTGKQVSTIVLLAIPASQQEKNHLRILSQLSRLLLRESFRDSLNQATSPETLEQLLLRELGC